MNLNEIERALRELRLSGIADTLSTRVLQAQSSQEPFLATLGAMLQDEIDRRHSRLTERLVADALQALDAAPSAEPLTQQHELIRPAEEYADLFARAAAESLNHERSPQHDPQ